MGIPGVVDSDSSSEVAQVVMTGRLPPGPGGPLVGGVPPDDRGPRGDHWGHHECRVLYI
jgi:hypothetical protein